MTGYLVAQLNVTDARGFDTYRAAVPSIIEAFGGRYLIRGGEPEVREGDWPAPRLVVIAFDSLAAARRFYESPEYQEILPLRRAASKGSVALLPGVDEG